jgi:hypothetical protein
MNDNSTKKVLFLQAALFLLFVVSSFLMSFNVIGIVELIVVFLFVMFGYFYLLTYEKNKIQGILSGLAKELGTPLTKTKNTFFPGNEFSFKYKDHHMIISLSPPYKAKILDVDDFFWGLGLTREIYFHVGYSSPRVIHANILFGEPLCNPSAKDINERYNIKIEIAELILKLTNGKIYLRQNFFVYADRRNVIVDNEYFKEKLGILEQIAEALGKG